ncbi:serine family amino acid catabolism-related protein [Dothidotthia symphoricarpi CBS 119687]|uniref:L-serine ammonia-lyase n=1 Tax=Dothidotthia symphoricarpi CBS 119687 TaxID=1392245 RepID=A0A6A5ZXZ5_9PLEO|nr:serine family amino acid catabolism-related protein [Dothidotthia symphoricarpi CBS 119687]KAF2123895.1 serine family amino acid catabolism-related protein [Dothidotthia symphoricarpi CBS 119687]
MTLDTMADAQQDLPQPWRQTPLIHSTLLSKHAGCQIYLKLENLQPSGSFKSRGIGNFLLAHLAKTANTEEREAVHFYSSSGGNAGLACVHAAVTLGTPATIIVPMSTTEYTIAKMRAAGAAEVIQHGDSWAEADGFLKETVIPLANAKGEHAVYVPPFDASEIWDGHATMVEEIFKQLGPSSQPPDALICSVGGGGLFCGIMRGLENVNHPNLRVLAVETEGAHSLALSLEKGKLSTLPAITSIATTLGARTVASQAFAYAQRNSVRSVVLSDSVAKEGCVRFADDERIMVEAACGVSLALCYNGRLKEILPNLQRQSKVVIIVCGGSNITAKMLGDWSESM